MSAFDGNHDDHLNMKEWLDGMKFRYRDRDNDGVMNHPEFSRVERNFVEYSTDDLTEW